MVFAIEPMFVSGPDNETRIADDGWTVLANGPTAHFEHTIVVAELGWPRTLTKMEEE
jgi:methionine aminopeptidase